MYSDLYWIDAPKRIAIMARPRAGDWLADEIDHWRREGVGLILSLLEPDEVEHLGLGDERAACEDAGIRFASFPIPDRGVPKQPEAALQIASGLFAEATPVAIHCRAGIGRSALMAALVLVGRGLSADEAFGAIAAARRLPVPDTLAQREWVAKHGRAFA